MMTTTLALVTYAVLADKFFARRQAVFDEACVRDDARSDR
jgi:hypothetical protein